MRPETPVGLAAADRFLLKARANLQIGLHDEAARMAYYAQFHAARAIILDRTASSAKTHKGVRRLFHQIAKDTPRLDRRLAGDLTNAYRFKELADYNPSRQSW